MPHYAREVERRELGVMSAVWKFALLVGFALGIANLNAAATCADSGGCAFPPGSGAPFFSSRSWLSFRSSFGSSFFRFGQAQAALRGGASGQISNEPSNEPSSADKKLSRAEFGALPILPTGSALLANSTELNVLVDMACLHDPGRGPKALPWLIDLANAVKRVPTRKTGSQQISHRWTLERDWDFFELQNAFEQEPCVVLVSPEGRFYIHSTPGDPYYRDQAYLARLNFAKAIEDFFMPILQRPKVILAVIDTGVDFSHVDLRMNRWKNPGEIVANGFDDDANGFVDDVDGYNFASDSNWTGPEGDWPENKHGTHVAGLAAARFDNNIGIVGVHGAAKIMSINVFGQNGFSRSSILENAIRYAADKRADIINMSLGGREYSRTMRAALQYAIQRGSFIVTAAGNDGLELSDNPTSFDFISPGVYASTLEGMLVTGSVDVETGRYSSFSNYSNRLVEISAPGAFTSDGQLVGLLSTVPGDSYGYLAGTSMASPILSGGLALVVTWLRAYRYPVAPKTLELIMRSSARQETGLAAAVQNGRTLDLQKLALYLKTNYPPR